VLDLMERGDIEQATEEIAAHETLAARLRLPAYEWWGPMWRSSLAIAEARFDEARRLIDRFRSIDDPNARLYAEIQGFVMALVRGDVSTLEIYPIERETGRPAEYAYRAGYAWVLALQGRASEARAQIDYAVAHMKDDMNRLAALAELSQALRILDEPGPADRLYELLAPYADRNIVNARGAAGYGSASAHLAVLARLSGRDPEPHLAAAEAHNRRLGATTWLQTRTERSAGSTFSP
jgi:hypothetical protein